MYVYIYIYIWKFIVNLLNDGQHKFIKFEFMKSLWSLNYGSDRELAPKFV